MHTFVKSTNVYFKCSILPVLSKALESIMKDQIMSLCNERNLLKRFQSSFKPGHSTTGALLKITDDVSMEMDRRSQHFQATDQKFWPYSWETDSP
jgi:hypothetical protein